MTRSLASVCFVAALLLSLSFAAHASITVTALTGRVMIGDAIAPGVAVTIASPALQQPRTSITNANGEYWFEALPPGTYDVTFSRSGLTSLTRPVVVELGRVARADGRLEESEDEESITSTATTITVAETTAITTHFSEGELDRLPLPFDRISATALAPASFINVVLVDDVPFSGFLGFEGIEQLTVFRGGNPVELAVGGFDVITARTPSGGEEFSLTLRDTFVNTRGRSGHLLESASGGRIIRERLWFFARGWGGDPFDGWKTSGLQFKLTGQAAAAHNVIASYSESEVSTQHFETEQSAAALRYTGIFGPRLTAEMIAYRLEIGAAPFGGTSSTAGTARLSYVVGSHVVSGGVQHWQRAGGTAFFVADRWSAGRFTVNTGLRRDDGERVRPHVAATYDLFGDGRRAVVASWGNDPYRGFDGQERSARALTVGYATALGASGSARVDYVRRTFGGFDASGVHAEARYRLFERFDAGGSYSWSLDEVPGAFGDHYGNAWLGAQFPIRSHELGVTVLERYVFGDWSTDAAVRYAVPFSRFGLTLGVDSTNVFAQEAFMSPRSWRFWVRLRV